MKMTGSHRYATFAELTGPAPRRSDADADCPTCGMERCPLGPLGLETVACNCGGLCHGHDGRSTDVSVASITVEQSHVVTRYLSICVDGQCVRVTLAQWDEVQRLAAAELTGERHRFGVSGKLHPVGSCGVARCGSCAEESE